MKRVGVSALLAGVLIASALPSANAVVTPGSKCSKVGTKQTYKGKVYTCIQLGKKLYWNNGKKVSTPKPTPKATPKATPIPTPTPTPTVKVQLEEFTFYAQRTLFEGGGNYELR
jgi:hypothetical protein